MTSVVKLVQIIGASVRLEGSLGVIQGSKQDQQWSHNWLPGALFGWVHMPPKMESCFCVPTVMFFISEWTVFSLCLDWTISISPSHPPAMQKVKSLALLALSSCWTPLPMLSLCLRKGQSLLPSSFWLCFSWQSLACCWLSLLPHV